MSEITVSAKINDYWTSTKEEHSRWEGGAVENWGFMKGGEGQWDSKSLELLKREGRPALTFNKVASIINLVSGSQRQNRQDIKIHPRKGGMREFAEIYTVLIKSVYDMTNGNYEESLAFLDGLICQKGWMGIDLSYEEDIINGDLILARKNPFNIREDPSSDKYDLSDAQFIFDSSWVSKQQLRLLFPSKADDLGKIEIPSGDIQVSGWDEGDEYRDAPRQKLIDKARYKYLTKSCWHKSYQKRTLLIDTINLEVYDYDNDKRFNAGAKGMIAKMSKESNRFKVIERVMPKLHLSTTIGDLVLQDVENPFGHFKMTEIPLVRFCPYWLNGDAKGMLDDLKAPQQEVNKRRSQLLHNLNQVANSGWEIPVQAEVDEDKFKKEGSKSGFTYTYKHPFKPNRIPPMTPATGYERMAENADADLYKISGVNPDLMGMPEQDISGKAMQLRQRQGNIVIEGMFDNFRFSKQILGQRLLNFIRYTNVFSEAEIKAIAEEEEKEFPVGLLKSRMVGRYGVKVDLSPNAPTIRLSNFMTLVELRKAGLPIPDEVLIKAGDFPNKDEIIEALKAAQQASPIDPNVKVGAGSKRQAGAA